MRQVESATRMDRNGHRWALACVAAIAASSAVGCGGGGESDAGIGDAGGVVVIEATFEAGAEGWVADFADYPVEDAVADPTLYALEEGVRDMPLVGGGARGFLLAGTNRSDDLWMALVRQLESLPPDAPFRVRFEVEVASRAASGCVGVGGAPGESVFLKAGAAPGELRTGTGEDGRNRVWVRPDKGNQSMDGPDSVALGNVATGRECGDDTWVLLRRTGELEARSDTSGRLTLFVGTDSGYEGRTELYYDRIRVELSPAP